MLTLDNHAAEFSNQETFYVKLEGQSADGDAVDLVPITYGATLKVKPHIIYQDDKPHEILLTLDIQDGRRSADTQEVDGVPSVTNSTIKTQAVVSNGKSLLIGGYKVAHESVSLRRVPLLGYVPVIGLFFRAQSTTGLDTRRYFLISPRLVTSEVVFKPNVQSDELRERDDAAYQERYQTQAEAPPTPKPRERLSQNRNGFRRTHSGPP